jgi:hypothetical protein
MCSTPMAAEHDFAHRVIEECTRRGRAAARDEPWLKVGPHVSASIPSQGWKLHVSAGVLTASEVLRRCLPILLDGDVPFKVLSSTPKLSALNDGRGGASQVGKFITVYPNSDDDAVRLARALDAATANLSGPAIPSDRPLRPNSLVHYRFGGFGSTWMRTPLGEAVRALVSPTGDLVVDVRSSFQPPSWTQDPFVASGAAGEPKPARRIIADRFVVAAVLHASPRSTVYLCLDLSDATKCVLKHVTDSGARRTERLRAEYEALSQLCPDPRFPSPLAIFEDAEGCFLAMEDIEGQPFQDVLMSLRNRGILPRTEQIVGWGCEIAAMLQSINDRGFLYVDLKPSNILVAADGSLRLIDFDCAWPHPSVLPAEHAKWLGGTPGYMSPQRISGSVPQLTDDVYALGAILYLFVTGAEPSCAPNTRELLSRPIELLNPDVDPAVAEVIRRCLDPSPKARYASASQCRQVLQRIADSRERESGTTCAAAVVLAGSSCVALARRIGDSLCDAILSEPGRRPFLWPQSPLGGETPWGTDLNIGGAGAALALSELVTEFDDTKYRDALGSCARWLVNAPRPGGQLMAGLYVGESGVAAAQLRAGQVLGNDSLIGRAVELQTKVAAIAHHSPDLFNGTAGRMRAHLWFAGATADPVHLQWAMDAGERLLRTAQHADECVYWTMPASYEQLGGKRLTGYAHGAAGIADALLDLYEVTTDAVLLEAALGVGRWLERLVTPALDGGAGLNWGPDDQSVASMAYWCHGAAGVARFLFRLHAFSNDATALQTALRAVRTVASATRWSSSPQCHGLAGNIECLLDAYSVTGSNSYLEEAGQLGALLPAFAGSRGGRWHFTTSHDVSNPGFTNGCAGVVSALLRLAHRGRRPHLLTLQGFPPQEPTAASAS